MAVTAGEVRHIAMLARLGIEDERIASLERELNAILAHMAVLERVDTSQVPSAAGVGDGGMPLREDVGAPIPLARPVSAFAPSVNDGFLTVPRLATHEDASESSA